MEALPEDVVPKEPMALKFASLYVNDEASKLRVMLAMMSAHTVPVCACENTTCLYFRWHYRHFSNCQVRPCVSCQECDRLKRWVQAHTEVCLTPACQLQQCCQAKSKKVKRIVARNHDTFETFSSSGHSQAHQPRLIQRSGASSIDLPSPRIFRCPSPSPTKEQPRAVTPTSLHAAEPPALPYTPHHRHTPHTPYTHTPHTPHPYLANRPANADQQISNALPSYSHTHSGNSTNQNRDEPVASRHQTENAFTRRKSDSLSSAVLTRSAPQNSQMISQSNTTAHPSVFVRNTSVNNDTYSPLTARHAPSEVSQTEKKPPLQRMDCIDNQLEQLTEVEDDRSVEERLHPPLQRLDTDPELSKVILESSIQKRVFDQMRSKRDTIRELSSFLSQPSEVGTVHNVDLSQDYQVSSSSLPSSLNHTHPSAPPPLPPVGTVDNVDLQKHVSQDHLISPPCLPSSLNRTHPSAPPPLPPPPSSSLPGEIPPGNRGNSPSGGGSGRGESPSGYTSPNAGGSHSSGFCEPLLTTSPSDSGGEEESYTSLQSEHYYQSVDEMENSNSTIVPSEASNYQFMSTHQNTPPVPSTFPPPPPPTPPSTPSHPHTHLTPQQAVLDAAIIAQQQPSLDFEQRNNLEAPASYKPPKNGPRFDPRTDFFDPRWLQPSQRNPAMERELYERFIANGGFPTDETAIREIYDHRTHVRNHLAEQFSCCRVYREGVHWRREWELGRGAQAAVFNISDLSTAGSLVLKEMKENRHALDEAYVCLKLLKHSFTSPNIVEYFGAARLPRPSGTLLQLFLELMPVCMQGYLYNMGPLSPETVRHYAVQLFEGLDHLHNTLGIIHCDIKPGNVLVDETAQRVKIADFGSAELLEESQLGASFRSETPHGTDSYNPPELHRDKCCGYALDVWQAGHTVLAMASGRRPWRHCYMDVHPDFKRHTLARVSRESNKKKIIEHHSRPGSYPLPEFLDPNTRKVLHGCLQFSHGCRVSAQDCAYLLAMADATSDQQRQGVLDVYKYGRNPEVLRSPACYQRPMIDVYLSSRHSAEILSLRHVLEGGWLGSIPWEHSITYSDLRDLRREFPVLDHLGAYSLSVCDNCPQAIWKTINGHGGGVSFDQVLCYSAVVDHTKAVVISAADTSSSSK